MPVSIRAGLYVLKTVYNFLMPRIAEFFGIVISMFYKEHAPLHFHAVYSQFEATVTIDPIQINKGKLPPRVRSLVFEWAAMYQQELMRLTSRPKRCMNYPMRNQNRADESE